MPHGARKAAGASNYTETQIDYARYCSASRREWSNKAYGPPSSLVPSLSGPLPAEQCGRSQSHIHSAHEISRPRNRMTLAVRLEGVHFLKDWFSLPWRKPAKS